MSNSTTTANGADEKNGFGAKLTTARKKRGMSVDAVASELNILKRHVEAIEAQAYDALPQFAFARGFVANYAKLVGLSGDELVKEFEANYPKHLKQDSIESIKSPVQPMGTLTRGRAPIRINFGLVLGLIALLILAATILKMIGGTKSVVADEAVSDTQVVESLTITEQAQGAAVGNAGSVIDIPMLSSESTAPAVVATGNEGTLEFWVKDKVNIVVKDGKDETLMTGVQNRGGYELKGQTPFSVEIDNASKVDVNFNKNPVSLKSYGSNKATLNFE